MTTPALRADADEAQRRADQIRTLTSSVEEQIDALAGLVAEAYRLRDWEALGYDSWDAYVDAEFGSNRLKLDRDERRDVVVEMRSLGMSTRAIGSALGVHKDTIRGDLDAVGGEKSPPAAVAGLDGKTYTPPSPEPEPEVVEAELVEDEPAVPEPKPSPRPASRRPLPAFAKDAGWSLRQDVERLERIFTDDRFPSNKAKVAAHLHGHLTYAAEVCQDLLNRLSQQEGD